MYYIAHRLFALHDRALGSQVAEELARKVGADHVFLPFCDTGEEDLVHACKGRRLYELDRERLAHLHGMIAVLHGPSVDDGVCMEIGFARACGVPVVVLTTDFQTYGPTANGLRWAFPDPLIEVVTNGVLRAHRLGRAPASARNRLVAFREQNLSPLRDAAANVVQLLLVQPRQPVNPQVSEASTRRILLEPSPYRADDAWLRIVPHLEGTGRETYVTRRLQSAGDSLAHAHVDWQQLTCAGQLVVDVNGPETPPGAAIMIGASAAVGRRVVALYADRSLTFAPGREPNFRNLMIQYSVDARGATVGQICNLLTV